MAIEGELVEKGVCTASGVERYSRRGPESLIRAVMHYVRDAEAGVDVEASRLQQEADALSLDAENREERITALALAAANVAGRREALDGLMATIIGVERPLPLPAGPATDIDQIAA
jgi:hypothetical protein